MLVTKLIVGFLNQTLPVTTVFQKHRICHPTLSCTIVLNAAVKFKTHRNIELQLKCNVKKARTERQAKLIQISKRRTNLSSVTLPVWKNDFNLYYIWLPCVPVPGERTHAHTLPNTSQTASAARHVRTEQQSLPSLPSPPSIQVGSVHEQPHKTSNGNETRRGPLK